MCNKQTSLRVYKIGVLWKRERDYLSGKYSITSKLKKINYGL